jgi:CDP-diacylglycerol--serine O-phosphatidyltransferase
MLILYITFEDAVELIILPAFCGVMSVFSSLRYCIGGSSNSRDLHWALIFVPLGLFFDIMDGKVARCMKSVSQMGQELDSFADMVCPSFQPSILLLSLMLTLLQFS